ncbi:hypothetical protein FRC08_013851 [Ceratobasidium sp. 394]|nr:hypothetical protein FRC08_013851 [Ceratobasidium sp. 394]KAG9086367.1 hypothetical protein FS749_003685 [Ceratobasidium sp. UAMH 11750]
MRWFFITLISVFCVLIRTVFGKRGVAWPWFNENTPLDPERLVTSNVVWMYNWETWRPSKTTNLNWIGTQRCMDCDSSPIAQLPDRAVGWDTILTLNEPDITGTLPADAAAWYIQHINPLNLKKATPAVTSSQSPGQGLDWLTQFISACAGNCYIDYINLHWYGTLFTDFQAQVERAHAQFPNYSIIISEFALQYPATQIDQAAFLRQAIPYLDNATYVAYYAYFIASSPLLFSANDPIGVAYAGNTSTLYNNDGGLSEIGLVYTQ